MKKLFFCAFLCSLMYSSLHAQTSPRVISYQGLLRPAGSMTGSQIAGNRLLTVTLYGDAEGTVKLWQSTMTTLIDSSGVFNCLLGTQDNPLPEATALDRPIWVGIAVGSSAEMRPLAQFTASPYALNVADSSITSSKLNMNYVSSISVNGQPITGVGTNLNLVAGNGLNLTWVPTASTLTLSGTGGVGDGKTMSVDWQLGGNSISSPSTEFLGTTDSEALEIHVNGGGDTLDGNGRVMLYQPMPESPNITGGYRGNSITSSFEGGNVIAGGGWAMYPNMATNEFATVGGGAGNSATNGGTVAGGELNTAGESGAVGGGNENYAGYQAVVSGGLEDTANSQGSVVSGGTLNKALNDGAVVSGGTSNIADTVFSTVSGGDLNIASGYASNVGGGYNNTASGTESAVGGGYLNTAGSRSAIPGGFNLTIDSNSFGVNALSYANTGGTLAVSVEQPNVAFFGNMDMYLANTDDSAREFRFYGPNLGGNVFNPSSGYGYTSFKYDYGNIIHYILPPAQGLAYQVLTNDGTGQLSWAYPGYGSWSITGNLGTSPPTNFLGTVDSNSLELHIFDNGSSTYGDKRVMRYEINDTSANLLGGYHDNAVTGTHLVGVTIAGGGSLHHADTVKGSYAVISGGRSNADTVFAFVGGGDSNRAMGAYSSVTAGFHNTIASQAGTRQNSPDYAVINGGKLNTIDTSGARSIISGGANNYVGDSASVIAGGTDNTIESDSSHLNQGHHNVILGGASNSIIRADDNTTSSAYTTYDVIAGGKGNVTSEQGSVVGGGIGNSALEEWSVVSGGQYNWNHSLSSVIAGGANDTIRDGPSGSAIGGGVSNLIVDSAFSPSVALDITIPGGTGLIGQSFSQTVIGEYNRTQGNSGGASLPGRITGDRLFIIGNGTDTGILQTVVRSNAFEVSENGHSIVYGTNGSGGATAGATPPFNGAIYGARYQDNTCYAWGDAKGIFGSLPCSGSMQVNSDFGVDSIVYECIGQYRVYLHTVDPYTGSQVDFTHGFAVTTSSVVIAAGVPPFVTVQVTQLNWGGIGLNAFDIYLLSTTGPVNGEVMFHVFGRE